MIVMIFELYLAWYLARKQRRQKERLLRRQAQNELINIEAFEGQSTENDDVGDFESIQNDTSVVVSTQRAGRRQI